MREIDVMTEISGLGELFTGTKARECLGLEKGAFYYHIRRLERDGIIERMGRNRYRLAFLRDVSPDSFAVSSVMIEKSAVGYWSALNYYGFTEQMPRITYVMTPLRGNYKRLENYSIKAVIVREKKFFGFREVHIAGRTVRITDPEKTVADCLDRPRNCGGILEIAKALRSGMNVKIVAENLKKMGGHAGLKRLGYLSEILDVAIGKDLKEEIKAVGGYPLLDPSLGRKGHWNTKWGLLVNIPKGYLEEGI